jgi:hypothetical protein
MTITESMVIHQLIRTTANARKARFTQPSLSQALANSARQAQVG